MNRQALALALLAGLANACGGGSKSGAAPSGGPPTNDGSANLNDHGRVSTTYPAFAVDAPQVVGNSHAVLTHPVIVTVTWPAADSNATMWEAFGDGIGTSAFWTATTSEYGFGAATSGPANHVRETQPLPAALDYGGLANFVIGKLAGASDGGMAGASDGGMTGATSDGAPAAAGPTWPAPTIDNGGVETIYSLFIPASVKISDPGSGLGFCDEGGYGYHDSVLVGGDAVPYTVTLECPRQNLDTYESTASHEDIEAATNPYASTTHLGWTGFDSNHLSWDIYTGFYHELSDVCQNWASSYYQVGPSFPYWVQRIWSNAHAAAGHDPCVPDSGAPYHGMTLFPSQEVPVTVDLTSIGKGKVNTLGFSAAVGHSTTFQVGFYSDAATGGPWTISYDFPRSTQLFDMAGRPVANGAAVISIDKTSGQNGEKANVTVTPTQAGPLGFQIMAVTWDVVGSTSVYAPHYLPILISNQ